MTDNQVQAPKQSKLTVEQDDVPLPHHPCKYKEIFPHVDEDVDTHTQHIWTLDSQELKLQALNEYIDTQLNSFRRWNARLHLFNMQPLDPKDAVNKVMRNWSTDVQDQLKETIDSLELLKQDTVLSGTDELLKVKITWIKQHITTEFHYGNVAYFQ